MSFASATHVLFFEVGHEGHVASYTDALVAEAIRSDSLQRFTFAMSRRLYDRLLPQTRETFEQSNNIGFISISDDEVAACRKGNGFKQGPTRWQKANEIAERVGADHVFFYQMDSALYGAFKARKIGQMAFSGILFHPEMHLCLKRPPKSFKRFITQAIFYSLTFPLSNLRCIWTLDPIFPEFAARWLPNGKKVKFLPEISLPLPNMQSSNPRSSHRVTFLLYGIMKRRKGVMYLLDAMMDLQPALQEKVHLVLAGEIDKDLSDALPDAIRALQQKCPGLEITTIFKFLEEHKLTSLLTECDVVLAPYFGHVGSSGVVYTSARAGKPLLATNESLLGAIVERYDLGITINPNSRKELLDAITIFTERDSRELHGSRTRLEYIEKNSRDLAECILRN